MKEKIEKKKVETAAETKARENWEEASKRWWGVQIEYIRALRNSKDKESMEKAEKMVDALIEEIDKWEVEEAEQGTLTREKTVEGRKHRLPMLSR